MIADRLAYNSSQLAQVDGQSWLSYAGEGHGINGYIPYCRQLLSESFRGDKATTRKKPMHSSSQLAVDAVKRADFTTCRNRVNTQRAPQTPGGYRSINDARGLRLTHSLGRFLLLRQVAMFVAPVMLQGPTKLLQGLDQYLVHPL